VHDVRCVDEGRSSPLHDSWRSQPDRRTQANDRNCCWADGADIDNQQPGLDVIPVMLAPTPGGWRSFFVRARRQQKGEVERRANWHVGFVCNNSGKDPLGTLQVVVAPWNRLSAVRPPTATARYPAPQHANNAALVAFSFKHIKSAPAVLILIPPNATAPPRNGLRLKDQSLFPKARLRPTRFHR